MCPAGLTAPAGGARFYAEIARRSHALQALPGPKYGLFGIVSAVRRGDIHRHAAYSGSN